MYVKPQKTDASNGRVKFAQLKLRPILDWFNANRNVSGVIKSAGGARWHWKA